MKKIEITPADYRKYFLYQYYVNQRFIVRAMRILGGPILILMGLNFYTGHQYHIAITLFFIGYGFYYLLRPFIELAIRNPKEENFSFALENNHLLIEDGDNYSKLNLFDYPIQSDRKYFVVRGENNKVLFFPKEKLDKESFDQFMAAAS